MAGRSQLDEEIEDCLEIQLEPLNFTDFTGTGKLTRENLVEQLQYHFRKVPTTQELDLYFSVFESDELGRIDFKEWANFMKNVPKVCSIKTELVCSKLFDTYDSGKKGYLTLEDMRRVFREFGSEPNSDDEIRSEIAIYDTDKDGNLNYDDFKLMITPVLNVICNDAKKDLEVKIRESIQSISKENCEERKSV